MRICRDCGQDLHESAYQQSAGGHPCVFRICKSCLSTRQQQTKRRLWGNPLYRERVSRRLSRAQKKRQKKEGQIRESATKKQIRIAEKIRRDYNNSLLFDSYKNILSGIPNLISCKTADDIEAKIAVWALGRREFKGMSDREWSRFLEFAAKNIAGVSR